MLSDRRCWYHRSGPSFFHTRITVAVLFVIIIVGVMTTNGVDSLAADSTGSAGANSNAAANTNPNADSLSNPKDGPNLLPPPSDNNDPSIPTIKLGETIRFEQYGPIILNSDGTTRRIANWDQLTEAEQQTTWRRISKRNEERRKVLLAQQQGQETNQGQDNNDAQGGEL
mmetsp:Transcript_39752/g.95935  ORF Transcript_39752/g.95935 Transcript_39752/m.95935 type:complete len:170 (+) Transcript_39752:107-616(+)